MGFDWSLCFQQLEAFRAYGNVLKNGLFLSAAKGLRRARGRITLSLFQITGSM
jgi:hypothetical protein